MEQRVLFIHKGFKMKCLYKNLIYSNNDDIIWVLLSAVFLARYFIDLFLMASCDIVKGNRKKNNTPFEYPEYLVCDGGGCGTSWYNLLLQGHSYVKQLTKSWINLYSDAM